MSAQDFPEHGAKIVAPLVRRIVVLFATTSLLLVWSVVMGERLDADSLNTKALEVHIAYAEEDLSEYRHALQLLDQALALEPNHVPAHVNRLRVLIELMEGRRAYDAAAALYEVTGAAQDKLALCALREVIAWEDGNHNECYQAVADAVEDVEGKAAAVENLMYVFALKLADSPDFLDARHAHLEGMSTDIERAFRTTWIDEEDRAELLARTLPNQWVR